MIWYSSNCTLVISDITLVALISESTSKLTASSNPANKGSSVTLTCVVKGNPEPSKPVLTKTVSSSTTNIDMTCNGTTTKTCEKVFSSAVYTDSGDYTCNGENRINGVEKSSSDTLTLRIGDWMGIIVGSLLIMICFLVIQSQYFIKLEPIYMPNEVYGPVLWDSWLKRSFSFIA